MHVSCVKSLSDILALSVIEEYCIGSETCWRNETFSEYTQTNQLFEAASQEQTQFIQLSPNAILISCVVCTSSLASYQVQSARVVTTTETPSVFSSIVGVPTVPKLPLPVPPIPPVLPSAPGVCLWGLLVAQ